MFMSPDRNGKEEVAATINVGLIDATPGRFSGDFEINIPVNGQTVVTALTGPWDGQPAGLLTWPPGIMSIGGPNNWWRELWLMGVGCPANIPGTPKSCVRINNGVVGVY
jgi:hypothetical protein